MVGNFALQNNINEKLYKNILIAVKEQMKALTIANNNYYYNNGAGRTSFNKNLNNKAVANDLNKSAVTYDNSQV